MAGLSPSTVPTDVACIDGAMSSSTSCSALWPAASVTFSSKNVEGAVTVVVLRGGANSEYTWKSDRCTGMGKAFLGFFLIVEI